MSRARNPNTVISRAKMADQSGRNMQQHTTQTSTRGRKSPKPGQRKTGMEYGGSQQVPVTGVPTSHIAPAPGSLGILSSILRSPHPGIPRPQGVGAQEKTVHHQATIRHIQTLQPGASVRKQNPPAHSAGLSPSRTPITLPPKKSLSPSRMLYTERHSPQQRAVTPVSSHRETSPVSQTSHMIQAPSHRSVQEHVSQADLHLTSQSHQADIKPEGLFQQYRVKHPQHIPLETSEQIRMYALAKQAAQQAPKVPVQILAGRQSPVVSVHSSSHPQPAHQSGMTGTPPIQQVSTIRRTPSPAHVQIHVQRTTPEVKKESNSRSQAMNLSVPHDKAKDSWSGHVASHPKQPVKQETKWESDFRYGDLLQSIQQSHDNTQSQLLQRGLSPITPAEPDTNPHFNLDASSRPSHSAQPTHSVAQFYSSSETVRAHGQQAVYRRIIGPDGVPIHIPVSIPTPSTIPVPTAFVSTETVGFSPVVLPSSHVVSSHNPEQTSTVDKRSSPKPVVNIPASVHVPPEAGIIKQPVVSLVRLPSPVSSAAMEILRGNQDKDFIGQKNRFTPPPNVSLIQQAPPPNVSLVQQAPPPNVTVSSSGNIPFKTQRAIQSQKHSRNPFTFPATPPTSAANEIPSMDSVSQSKMSHDPGALEKAKQRHRSDDMPCLVPFSPFKTEVKKESDRTTALSNLVQMSNPFNQRLVTLSNFPNNSVYRPTYRATSVALHRAKAGCITSAAKSLDILRQNLQKHINKEIDAIIQQYLDKFFKKGVENIRLNNGENAVSDDHIQAVCRQMLEEAKKMYVSDTGRRSITPTHDVSDNVSETGSNGRRSALGRRRHPSDTDSDVSLRPPNLKKKKGRPLLTGRSTPSKLSKEQLRREGPKFEPERLTTETEFVMGSKANKAMGFGATRGRLYMKHPDLYKYSGDQDDKQWLYEHHFMPATGGKAYLLVLEDIKELGQTEEYRNSAGTTIDELKGFCVPQWMVEKMRTQMLAMRTDLPKQKHRSRSTTPSEVGPLQTEVEGNGVQVKELPFSNFSSPKVAQSSDLVQVSPVEEEMEFLSATGNHDNTGSGMSPFNMTGGFDDTASDLDALDDETALEPSFGLGK